MEPKAKSAPSSGFTGLTPPRLVVQTQAAFPQGTSQGAQVGNIINRLVLRLPTGCCLFTSCLRITAALCCVRFIHKVFFLLVE